LAADEPLKINNSVAIPRAELEVRASRSSGPGGQHVNTSSTRVDVTWNVRTSTALTEAQRERALKMLAPRLSADGSMRHEASDTRSQKQNRELAEQRLAEAVRRALMVPKKRKATRPTRSSVEKRLEGKKHSSDKKRARRRPTED